MKFELHGAICKEIKWNFPTLGLDSQNDASDENSQSCIICIYKIETYLNDLNFLSHTLLYAGY